MDYINGNKFAEIADFVIDFDNPEINFDLSKKAVIYCKTDFLARLFGYVRNSDKKYILISHMADYPINETRFKSKPNCVKKWFAENAVYNHPDLISIPLGLENHKGKSKGKFTNHEWFVNNIQRLRDNPKNIGLYCNWNNTNKERSSILSLLEGSDIKVCVGRQLPFEGYCNDMAKYKFVICPPGNGVDTHRVWEALYMGCYPIVINHRIYRDYDLPIIQVNNYSEVTWDLLNSFLRKKCSYKMLNMSYWKNKIMEEFNKS